MLWVPSLKPNRFRAVTWLVEVDDVRPKPSCDHRTAARPNAIRTRFRTAWTATCGSSAQAWTHRSPSDLSGSRLSAGKCGSRRRAAGCRAASPNRSRPWSRNRLGPKPKVMVSPVAGSPMASPVSSGGASYGPDVGPSSPAGSAAVIRAAASVQSRSRPMSSARDSAVTSKAAKCSRSWAGVTIPAWWLP